MLNLSTIIESSARTYPNKNAFTFANKNLTFAQINGAANQVANGLIALGINAGDKVALSCLNLPYFPIIYYGILKAGAIVVPLSVLLKSEEVAFHLRDSEAKAYICFEGTDDLPMGIEGLLGFNKAGSCEHLFVIPADPSGTLEMNGVRNYTELITDQPGTFEMVQTSGEDVAVIIYTSGTTGQPKGAQLTHSNLFLNALATSDLLKLSSEDIQLIVLPLFHIFAMTCQMNTGVYRAASSVLLPRFEGETVLNLMKEHKVSVFAGVPTMYWGLLNSAEKYKDLDIVIKNLRIAISGGAALPHTILSEFGEKFKVQILEGFGMSEGSPVVTFNQSEVGTKPNSIGTPIWGVHVKLVDEKGNEVPVGEKGELIYKGHNVMKGYYNRPEANIAALRDGWMYSGDIAIKDEDGFYFIVDRKKDMVIRGGLNVYPREVEEVMMKHPAVSLVAVIGVPDVKLGEEVKAFVQLKENMSVTSQELIQWTKQKIAAYKYPRTIDIVSALPTSATGKILKKELRKIGMSEEELEMSEEE